MTDVVHDGITYYKYTVELDTVGRVTVYGRNSDEAARIAEGRYPGSEAWSVFQ